jgi:wyosine [tRNA(Phe)-imidazoG37] synthetase (radical SAM superfamily)
MSQSLSTTNHSRDIAGLKYIYPVMSRRAGGLSIGINFNTNNACNWRCIYCQVPDLQRGSAPAMDFELLAQELRFFLDQVLHGNFFDQYAVSSEHRLIKDIAISGNGEPTSLPDFDKAVALIGKIATQAGVFPAAHFVLISNGSLMHQVSTQAGLQALAGFGGEVWFKLDSGSEAGRKLINNSVQSQSRLLANLKIASQLCPTKLQTCMLSFRKQLWIGSEKQAYLQLLDQIKKQDIAIEKIMLYGIARQSFQPEAAELKKMDLNEMQDFAADIKAMGFDVSVSN